MTARRRDKALAFVASAARAGKDLIQMTRPIHTPPAGPTAAELRARRPALVAQIDAANTAIATARTEHESAFTAFAADENEEHSKALWLAEQRIKARERRAVELTAELEAHDGATNVAERSEKEARADAIGVELRDNTVIQELAAESAAAAAVLVQVLLRMREHNVVRGKLRAELLELETALGRELTEPHLSVHSRRIDAFWGLVAAGLRELAEGESDNARRGYLLALAQAPIDLRSL
jgi:hypothetical protein